MKNRISTLFLIAVIGSMIGCDAAVVPPSDAPLILEDAAAAKASGQGVLLHELAQVRRATATYRNVANAVADGYVDIGLCVPGQGCHFLKGELLDDTFDPEKPELLLYAPNPPGNHLRLVAVEYAVPVVLSPDPPAGFTGDQDVWETVAPPGWWVLHAWVWQGNPNGVFADTNPHVP